MLTHAPSTAPLAKSHNVGEGTNSNPSIINHQSSIHSSLSKPNINHQSSIINSFFSLKRPTNKQTNAITKLQTGYKLCQCEVLVGSRARSGSRRSKNRPLPMQLRRATALAIRETIQKRREAGEGLAKTQLMTSINKASETGVVARDL